MSIHYIIHYWSQASEIRKVSTARKPELSFHYMTKPVAEIVTKRVFFFFVFLYPVGIWNYPTFCNNQSVAQIERFVAGVKTCSMANGMIKTYTASSVV